VGEKANGQGGTRERCCRGGRRGEGRREVGREEKWLVLTFLGIFNPNDAYIPFQDMALVFPEKMNLIQRVQNYLAKLFFSKVSASNCFYYLKKKIGL
jgi:hypothetical protein